MAVCPPEGVKNISLFFGQNLSHFGLNCSPVKIETAERSNSTQMIPAAVKVHEEVEARD